MKGYSAALPGRGLLGGLPVREDHTRESNYAGSAGEGVGVGTGGAVGDEFVVIAALIDHSIPAFQSASIRTHGPSPAISAATARWAARIVLPLPPFWLARTMVFIFRSFVLSSFRVRPITRFRFFFLLWE